MIRFNILPKDSQHPVFRNMFAVLQANPDLMVHDNDKGLERVKEGGYAYFMESTSLEYFLERECEVAQVGDLIDERNHAIGMPKSELGLRQNKF